MRQTEPVVGQSESEFRKNRREAALAMGAAKSALMNAKGLLDNNGENTEMFISILKALDSEKERLFG